MNRTLISRLVIGALVSIAAGSAMAGQIQASSVSIAREVITTDAQAVTAPSIAYRFAGDVDARVQTQTFQVQFTLGLGEWLTVPDVGNFSITDGLTGVVINQEAAAALGAPAYEVTAHALSADKKTVYATFTVQQDAAFGLIKQPLISVNVGTNTIGGVAATDVSGTRGTITKLKTVVGDLVTDFTSSGLCTANKTLPVNVKHFVALTAPGSLADASNATADEHLRGGATNDATLVVFPTNVKVNFAPSTAGAILTPGGNTTFSNSVGGTSWVDGNTVMLGAISLAQNSLGYDSDLAHQYVLAGVAGGGSAAGLDDVAVAARNVGDVEVSAVSVAVSASQGFVVGGTLYATVAANCGGAVLGTTAITAANAAGPITVTIPTANVETAFGVAGTGPVHVCYDAPGAVTIPSSAFTAVGRVIKAAPGGDNAEQDNLCNGNLYSLGGGLKIDVRNYLSSRETNGFFSVIRFVNNSDVRAADVWGQIINQDGSLGNSGLLIASLPVRGVLNLTAAQIEALLTTAPNAGAANGATTIAPNVGQGAVRLRITSNSGASLRVQNYIYNPATGAIFEGSNSQGVDFEGTTNRAPVNEGQYQSQDANSGINLQ